jgi:hypothetical protein
MQGIWFAIMGLASVLIGVGGGVLSWLGGLNVSNAVLAGAGAFAGALILMITVWNCFT